LSTASDKRAARAIEDGYEASEPSLRPIGLFLIGLTALTVVGLLVSSWLEDSFAGDTERKGPHPMESFRRPPTGPLLQATSGGEAAEIHAAEEQLLATYGWIDEKNGVVHVPIEVAIEAVLARGLPVRTRQPNPGKEESR